MGGSSKRRQHQLIGRDKKYRDASIALIWGLTDWNGGVKLSQRSELFPIIGVRGPRGNFTPNYHTTSDQRSRRGEAFVARILHKFIGLAALSFLAVSTTSAAPDWCNPYVNNYSPGFFDYIRGLSLPQAFATVGIYSPSGPYTQAVTMSVSGAGSVTCTPGLAGNVFVCPFDSLLAEGSHTASYTCTAVDQYGNPAGTDTETINFTMDNTAPSATISGPTSGTVFSPYSTITVRGSIQDISPLTYLDAASSNGPPSAIRISGNNFEFDFCLTSSTGNFFSTVSTTALIVNIGAVDSVGLGAFAGSGGLSSITVIIDGAPPAVDFSSSAIGSLKQITSIRGTASDNYKLDTVQLTLREDSTGRYWNGSQFAAGVTTITIPLPQIENSSWEYAGLNSDEMKSDSSYTVTATAFDFLHNGTAVLGVLELTSTFVGEGVVSDMFDIALVQFLVPQTPTPYMGMGNAREFCVRYSSPANKNSVHFEAYPRNSVTAWYQSKLDPQCTAPDELLKIESIIPTSSNPQPPLVTGCDDHTEIRAYLGSQIVGRLGYDIITPKKEYSQIFGFINHMMNPFSPQTTNFLPANCPPKYPNCMGYEHVIVFEKGDSETRPMILAPFPIVTEKVDSIVPGCSNSSETGNSPALPDGSRPYTVGDLNGYKGPPANPLFPANCTDHETQRFFIGKCVLGPVNLVKQVRVVRGGNHMFMTRSDHDTNSAPYPPPPP